MKNAENTTLTVTGLEMATLLGVSVRRVNQLANEGIVVRIEAGKFDAAASVQNMIKHASRRDEAKGAELDLNRERARLAKEQADGQELKNALFRQEYLKADEVGRAWSEITIMIRQGILACPSRIRHRLPHLTAHEADIIDQELRDALTALANDPLENERAESVSSSA